MIYYSLKTNRSNLKTPQTSMFLKNIFLENLDTLDPFNNLLKILYTSKLFS